MPRATWIRVSSGGLYYSKFLANSFAYLDLMLEDTAFEDHEMAKALARQVEVIDAVGDSPQTRSSKTELRFKRVDMFLDYLTERERTERTTYALDRRSDKLGDAVMAPIRTQFEREKTYVRSRLAQNAESTPEQLPLDPSLTDPDKELAALTVDPRSTDDAEEESDASTIDVPQGEPHSRETR